MTAAHNGILTIDDASTNDTGDYLCTAMSEVGVDQESTKITVIGQILYINDQPASLMPCLYFSGQTAHFC